MTKNRFSNRLAAGLLFLILLFSIISIHTKAVSSDGTDTEIEKEDIAAASKDGEIENQTAIRAVKYQVYDKRGKQIGKDKAISGFEDYGKTGILLPKATSYIKITDIKWNGPEEAKATIFSSDGTVYKKLQKIPRSSIEQGVGNLIITLEPGDGEPQQTYEVDFEIPETLLMDMNGVITIQDGNGYIPPKTVLNAALVNEGNEFDKIKESLKLYGGSNFQVYDIELKNDSSQPVTLDSGELVNLIIQKPELLSSDENIRLYHAAFRDGKAELVEIISGQDEKEIRVITNQTGYYVAALVDNVPQIPAIADKILYHKDRRLKDILLPDPESGTWTWADDSISPAVGWNMYEALYKPKEGYGYMNYRAYVRLDIVKAVSEIQNLSAGPLEYGAALSESALSGNAVYSGEEVKGTLKWKDSDTIAKCKNNGYDVLFVPEDSEHYAVVTLKAAIQVSPRKITVKIDDQTRDYADENPKFTFTVTEGSLAKVDSEENLNLNIRCEADETTPVGQAEITGQSDTADYEVGITPGILTIDKRPVVLKAKDVEAEYGSQIPQFEIEAKSGLAGDDTLEEAMITGTVEAEEYEGDIPSWGIYELVITSSGADESSNYKIGDTEKGYLNVTPVKAETDNHTDMRESDMAKISAAGDFTGGEKLNISNQTDKEAKLALKSKVKPEESLRLIFDASLQGEGKTSVVSGYQLTIPVDSKYQRTGVTILHYVKSGEINYQGEKVEKDTIDRYDHIPVEDGSAIIKVNSLSPFAVIVPKNLKSAQEHTAKITSDDVTTGENTPVVYLAGAGAITVIFMISPVFWMVSRRKKIGRRVDKKTLK